MHAAALSLVLAALPGPQEGPAPVQLELADGSTRTIAAGELSLADLVEGGGLEPLRILFARGTASLADARPDAEDLLEVHMLGGDRLSGRVGGGRDEEVLVESAGGVPIPISVDAIESLLFPARLPDDPGVAVERPAEGDRLYRRVGERLDRVDGTLDGFGPEGVRFEGLVGLSTVPWEELAALFVEPLGGPDDVQPDGHPVSVDLADGSRLGGGLLRLDPDGLGLELAGGTRILLELEQVLAVTSNDGRLRYLSELAPDRVQEGSAFGDELGMVFHHRTDRAVDGGPLVASGQRVARGIGVQAPSRLEWDLAVPEDETPWRELRGAVAVDAAVARLGVPGSVRFRIELDGEEVWSSAVLGHADGRVDWPALELTDARRLALVAEMEEDWNVGDMADWLDVRFVR